MTNDSESINKFYKTGFWVASAGLGLGLWGIMEGFNVVGQIFQLRPYRALLPTRIVFASVNAVTRACALLKRKKRL